MENNSSSIPEIELCVELSERELEIASYVKFWCEVVLLGIISTTGIILNCLAIFIFFTKKTLQNFFNFLLINLLIFDSVFLLLIFIELVIKDYIFQDEALTYFFAKFLYPVRSIAMTGSIYMTLVLALERYVSTNHPIAYQRYSSGSMSYIKCYLICVLPVILFSILFNISVFFEMSVYYYEQEDSTATSNVMITPTTLRLHPSYVTYYINYGRLFITGIVPFLGLFFCNIMVYIQMKKLMRFSDQSESKKEYELARVLVVIVLVFIICHIPRLGLNLGESINQGNNCHYQSLWIISCLVINKLFLAINSSANVLIYGCLNEKFRSAMFCRRNNARNRDSNLEETNMATQMVELPSHVQVD